MKNKSIKLEYISFILGLLLFLKVLYSPLSTFKYIPTLTFWIPIILIILGTFLGWLTYFKNKKVEGNTTIGAKIFVICSTIVTIILATSFIFYEIN